MYLLMIGATPPILTVHTAAALSVSKQMSNTEYHSTNQGAEDHCDIGICGSVLHLQNNSTIPFLESGCAISDTEQGAGGDNG